MPELTGSVTGFVVICNFRLQSPRHNLQARILLIYSCQQSQTSPDPYIFSSVIGSQAENLASRPCAFSIL
jgi:hypothetical protein